MSLKSNENIKRKIVKRHLKQEENALLVSYKKALTNIDKDLASYYKRYAVDDVLPKNRIRRAQQLKGLKKSVDDEIIKIAKSEQKIIGDNIAETYKHGYYRSAHALDTEVGADLGFSMVSPKTVEAVVANKMGLIKWADATKANAAVLSRKIKTAIEQGIIQGHSLQKTSKAVQKQMQIGASKSIRIIRTETGRARVEGSLASYDEAEAAGLPLDRVWLSTLDSRTRDTHQSMDKQEADENDLFTFPSGVVTRGPHLSGVAAEDINCRCDVIVEIPEFDQSKLRAAKDPETGENVNVKNMDFDEWARINKIKFHETVQVQSPEKLLSRSAYVEAHKGEKSWRALYYDWSKLKVASGQKLTASQLKFFNENFDRYEATSIKTKGAVLIKKPLTMPRPKPVVPPVEVKFSEGVLKTDNFNVAEGWEARHEAHKAALKQRMGFDLKEVSLTNVHLPAFEEASKKFDKAIKSFTKPTIKSTAAAESWVSGAGNLAKFEKGLGKYGKTLEDIGNNSAIKHYNNRNIIIHTHRNYRAHAGHFNIGFDVRNNVSVQYHEYGHLLEQNKNISYKSRHWLSKRSGGKTEHLNKISHHSDTQFAHVDKFIDPYVGKTYEATGHTEVLSMGMGQLTTTSNMMRFAKKDFDHFSFVHGILTGAI